MLKKYFLLLILFYAYLSNAQNPVTDGANWSVSNITANQELSYPNEITYGPDGNLWITERIGKRLVRVSPADGVNSKTIMLDLSTIVYQDSGQDGLLGFAVHPDLYSDINTTTNNYIFLAYVYDKDPGFDVERKLRIERYTYQSGTGTFDNSSGFTVIEDIDANDDHNGGRLKIGPDLKLYYSIGDLGSNQFANACKEIQSQDLPTSSTDYDAYKGKILRLNLDGTIPADNPTLNGVQSHVYTYGHRNAQGIIFSSDGKLYSSEHGPKVDDEINLIEAGKNYGWPEISGYYDNLGYEYCNWSNAGASCGNESYSTSSCHSAVTPLPEFTSHPTVPSDFKAPIGTYNSTAATSPIGGWLTWPTVGPSSIDIYEGGLIPDWGKSLFITSLKKGTIYRAKLNSSGNVLLQSDGDTEAINESDIYYEE